MRIKTQIATLVAVTVVSVLVTGAVAGFATHLVAEAMRGHRPIHPLIENITTLSTLSGDWFRRPGERIQQPWHLAATALVDDLVPALQGQGQLTQQTGDELLRDLHGAHDAFHEAVTRFGESGNLDDPYFEMINDRVNRHLQQAISTVYSASQITFDRVAQDVRRSYLLVAGVVAAAVLVSILAGFFVAQRVTRRLRAPMSAVASAAAEMAAAAEQQHRIAIQQAASLSQTTSTMDELATSARRSNEQATTSLATLETLGAEAQDGGERADEMLREMARLTTEVGAIDTQIRRVSEQSTQIDTVTLDVADLAAQTNLLALNAAVEAVRAGEHGRGFSVVAEEIRKLADESKRSAARIRALVAETRKDAEATVDVTEGGIKTLQHAVEVVEGSGALFKRVLAAFEGIGERMQQIALTTMQQSQAIEEAVTATETINVGAREAVTALDQTKRGIEQLRDVAEQAKAMV